MKSVKLINSQDEFHLEFGRCCKEYRELDIYTAWVGNPGNILPYSFLDGLDKVEIFLGISFDQSNPDGIKHLMDKKYKVVIIDDKHTYHPKLYFFKSKGKYALLMGSSNFTYAGFYQNVETNILLEGEEVQDQIKAYLTDIKSKVNGLNTFVPDNSWLNEYRTKYNLRQNKLREAKVKEETLKEDNQINSSSWLSNADWRTYVKHVNKGMKSHSEKYNETFDDKHTALLEYKKHLSTPWDV